MKARKLKQILNNTGYTVALYGEYIGIGSPLCHDLIKLDIATNKITYALDSYCKGRPSFRNEELSFIWDKLHELINTGELAEILDKNDVIENPLSVYTIRDGALFCTVTDAYGWPNVTVEGYMMHDNTYFKTAGEAIEYGIKEYNYWIQNLRQQRKEIIERKKEIEERISHCNEVIDGLKSLTPSQKGDVNYNMKDPNAKAEPATDPILEDADEMAGQQAAAESAAQDAATGASESAEEGSIEG